jgi:hypothetical protein
VKGEERRFVPDFEIRYFNADGSLAIIRITSHGTREEAESHAKLHQQDHARFELREFNTAAQRS